MNILSKLFGYILYGLGRILSVILDIFITIIDLIVTIVVTVGRSIIALVSMGGCLLIMVLGPTLLFHPATFPLVLFLIIVPIIGRKAVSYLKYIRYMVTEFLFDNADYLINGKGSGFQSFGEYGRKYIRMEEEKRRKEQQRRQAEQQRQWEERFKQWHEYQSYGGSHSYGYNNQTYTNPTTEFKEKYEKSCNLLGIGFKTDIYEVKLAYRKKAKEYHPDLNKAENATKLFQQVNDAYEFLSEDNIDRYKNMI